ncbi:MAG: hypothetical protein GY950_27020 [bacterium]|nr:hypothetical protein [bacterium]
MIAQIIGISVIIFLLDLVLAAKNDGSLLIGILFWAGVAQGIIALSAASDLTKGKWAKEIRPYLQEYYPLLLLFPIAFLIFARHITVYSWAGHHYSGWLEPTFFIIRNFLFLLLPFVFAHLYVRASEKESEKTGLYAVLYILFFVASQSFMAYDQVMTFEYPWINTLFGGYFFVESLYAGIAFSAILSGFLALRQASRFKGAFADFTLMIIGFALFWAGLFYSQYLVIWYGNIPEEVSYVSKRMAVPMLKNMGLYILLTLFLVPFLAMVSRKIKTAFPAVFVIAVLVFSGLIVERLIYLIPVANLSIPAVVLPLIVLGLPFLYLLFTQYKSTAAETID